MFTGFGDFDAHLSPKRQNMYNAIYFGRDKQAFSQNNRFEISQPASPCKQL